MAEIEIYTRPMCGFCHRARQLLSSKDVAFSEYDIWAETARREEMIQRSGGRTTVPQIFIDGIHVGGCDDLMALEASGKLDAMIGKAA